jgi:hypothetical protein
MAGLRGCKPSPGRDAYATGDPERRPPVPSPQASADLEPVDVGEHHVEQDHVVVVLGAEPRTVLAVGGDIDREPLLLQTSAKEGSHLRSVFDHERAHRRAKHPSNR